MDLRSFVPNAWTPSSFVERLAANTRPGDDEVTWLDAPSISISKGFLPELPGFLDVQRRTCPKLLTDFLDHVRSAQGHWLDVGTGDGQTLRAMAAQNPHVQFLATEIESGRIQSPTFGPASIRLHILRSNLKDERNQSSSEVTDEIQALWNQGFNFYTARLMYDLQEQKFDVVSHFFPHLFCEQDPLLLKFLRSAAQMRRPFERPVELAEMTLHLLQSNGLGIFVSEDKAGLLKVLHHLRRSGQVRSLQISQRAFNASELQQMGVVPYVLEGFERLGGRGHTSDRVQRIVLDRAFLLLFRKK